MQEVFVEDKLDYLQNNYLFKPVPELTDRRKCIQCDTEFIVGDYKVMRDEKGEEFICCPNAPGCPGTVLDWFIVDLL